MALQAKHNEKKFHVGDTVRVHYRIIEREKKSGKTKRSVEENVKERVQPFEGVVIGIKGAAENKSFTVRRLADQNIGVERVFPLVSPWIEKIEVKQRGLVRRAKLNYLRDRGNLEVRRIQPETKKQIALRKAQEKKAKKRDAKPVKKETAKKPVSKKGSSEKSKTRTTGRTSRTKVSPKK